jgi:hypothetical protein
MKEDILEQIVDDYLNLKGYFTMANVRFMPAKTADGHDPQQDSVPSDIDIVGINPKIEGPSRVVAVSCKSWQDGFWPKWEIEKIRSNGSHAGRERWRSYRELARDKWAVAFKDKIEAITGQREFEYWTVCLFVGASEIEHIPFWTQDPEFRNRLTPHLHIKTLHDLFRDIYVSLGTTPAGSEVGRLIQVMKAAKIRVEP